MKLIKECPFCHKSILSLFYEKHRKEHMEKRADGQMSDHISVDEKKRKDMKVH